jgi:hypothetical protein
MVVDFLVADVETWKMKHDPTRRGALLGALALAAPLPETLSGSQPIDPIMLAIAHSRAAFEAFAAAPNDSTYLNMMGMLKALPGTKPSTLAGVIGLLDYMHDLEADHRFGPEGWPDDPNDVQAELIENVRTALAKMASAGAA